MAMVYLIDILNHTTVTMPCFATIILLMSTVSYELFLGVVGGWAIPLKHGSLMYLKVNVDHLEAQSAPYFVAQYCNSAEGNKQCIKASILHLDVMTVLAAVSYSSTPSHKDTITVRTMDWTAIHRTG